MRNSKVAVVSSLLFATQNETGARIARSIFKKYKHAYPGHGDHLEPRDRVHPDQRRLRALHAERMARRLKAMGQANYARGFEVTLHEHALELPLWLNTPQRIFVNSMSDLFHQEVPTDFILRVFEVMGRADRHRYQILTKRSSRLRKISRRLPWAEYIWMGVTVENAECAGRIDDLREAGAAVKFLSIEPLLGPLPDLDLAGIDWVIVGGESGPGARPMREEWVLDIRDQCLRQGIPFFFKQWGG